MNAHTIITTAEPYRFEIGQAVDHIAGKLRSVIVDRYITSTGRENYHLAVSAEDAAGRPSRIVAGDHLVAR
ncbi:hypothetical protein FHX06_003680 [Rhizobium sp. BK512]|uniref:hypothetical protein n=1 Tax=Rhizobium sp. BK512 TaxID=2587010 RepID=UPI00161A98A4|nr:hypothetical protein [Rhizobium sp. BK512]MBB3562349.1 hypothetical protein [Rhizobium sp. BK512]